jgi:hypothetical protein
MNDNIVRIAIGIVPDRTGWTTTGQTKRDHRGPEPMDHARPEQTKIEAEHTEPGRTRPNLIGPHDAGCSGQAESYQIRPNRLGQSEEISEGSDKRKEKRADSRQRRGDIKG